MYETQSTFPLSTPIFTAGWKPDSTHPKSAMAVQALRVKCDFLVQAPTPSLTCFEHSKVPTLGFFLCRFLWFLHFPDFFPNHQKMEAQATKKTPQATQDAPKKHPNLPGGFLRGGFKGFFWEFSPGSLGKGSNLTYTPEDSLTWNLKSRFDGFGWFRCFSFFWRGHVNSQVNQPFILPGGVYHIFQLSNEKKTLVG